MNNEYDATQIILKKQYHTDVYFKNLKKFGIKPAGIAGDEWLVGPLVRSRSIVEENGINYLWSKIWWVAGRFVIDNEIAETLNNDYPIQVVIKLTTDNDRSELDFYEGKILFESIQEMVNKDIKYEFFINNLCTIKKVVVWIEKINNIE